MTRARGSQLVLTVPLTALCPPVRVLRFRMDDDAPPRRPPPVQMDLLQYRPRQLRPKSLGVGKGRQVLVTIGGETRNLVEWSKHLGVSHSTIKARVLRGWDPVEAVTAAKSNYWHMGLAEKQRYARTRARGKIGQ